MDNNFSDILSIFKKLDKTVATTKQKLAESNEFPGYWTGSMPASKAKSKMVGTDEETTEEKLQNKFNNQSSETEADNPVNNNSSKHKYRIGLTLSLGLTGYHPDDIESQKIQKICNVTTVGGLDHAMSTAVKHYKKSGYKVLDHWYIDGEPEQSLQEFGAGGVAGGTVGAIGDAPDPAADAKDLQITTQSLNKLGAITGTAIPASQTSKSLTTAAPPSAADNARAANIAKQIEPLLKDPAAASKLISLLKQQQGK